MKSPLCKRHIPSGEIPNPTHPTVSLCKFPHIILSSGLPDADRTIAYLNKSPPSFNSTLVQASLSNKFGHSTSCPCAICILYESSKPKIPQERMLDIEMIVMVYFVRSYLLIRVVQPVEIPPTLTLPTALLSVISLSLSLDVLPGACYSSWQTNTNRGRCRGKVRSSY